MDKTCLKVACALGTMGLTFGLIGKHVKKYKTFKLSQEQNALFKFKPVKSLLA